MTDSGSSRAVAWTQSAQDAERPLERITRGSCTTLPAGVPGVELREFVSARCGAKGISTGTGTFQPGAGLPFHKHSFSEALTILKGEASCNVEGRVYRLRPFDFIHIPAGTAHQTQNGSEDTLLALWVFATGIPSSEPVHGLYHTEDRGWAIPEDDDPEYIGRFQETPRYALSTGTRFCELFGGRDAAVGIRGGYGELDACSSLSYRVHNCDESVTIVTGEAICEVAGETYRLSDCDTLFVPRGRQHRFFNESGAPMGMIWARSAPEDGP